MGGGWSRELGCLSRGGPAPTSVLRLDNLEQVSGLHRKWETGLEGLWAPFLLNLTILWAYQLAWGSSVLQACHLTGWICGERVLNYKKGEGSWGKLRVRHSTAVFPRRTWWQAWEVDSRWWPFTHHLFFGTSWVLADCSGHLIALPCFIFTTALRGRCRW